MEKQFFLPSKVPFGPQVSKEMGLPEEKVCIFQTRVSNSCSAFSMAVLGSVPQLGSWDRIGPVIAMYKDTGVWQAKVKLPVNVDIEYKWILYDKYKSKIIEYETGENRRVKVIDKSILIQDFCDGVQKISELSPPEIEHLLHGKLNGFQCSSKETDNPTEESAQNTGSELLSGGPFHYDEDAVKQIKDLNPRIYVPDEYVDGTLKESCLRAKYDKDESIEQVNEHLPTRDIIQEEMIGQESQVYGQELARIFAENKTLRNINDDSDGGRISDKTVSKMKVSDEATDDIDGNNSIT